MSGNRLLAVVAVDAEAEALGARPGVVVVVGGIGRTNAAAATTEALIERGPFEAVCSIGIAGALPGGPAIGDLVVGREAVYAEEGIELPEGFGDMTALGFPLGGFEGNRLPADRRLLERALAGGPMHAGRTVAGAIATVATCSGTDRRAAEVASRTGAIAEAMEGAAVVHAALRRGVPAIEIRAISNTTGDRSGQRWDPPAALATLESSWPLLASQLRGGV